MKLCGAKTRSGGTCKHEAGWGTAHVGEGRCKLHGGNAGGPIKTGARAVKTSRQLREKIQLHLNDPTPLDLTPELALLRSLIDHFTEKMEQAEAERERLAEEFTPAELQGQKAPDPVEHFVQVTTPIVDNLRKVADTISKIQSRELLTAGEMTLVLVVLARVLREEVEDEQTLKRITRKLRRSLPIPGLIGTEIVLEPD